jgi:hypothetical protein
MRFRCFTCFVCGFESDTREGVSTHLETSHLETKRCQACNVRSDTSDIYRLNDGCIGFLCSTCLHYLDVILSDRAVGDSVSNETVEKTKKTFERRVIRFGGSGIPDWRRSRTKASFMEK